MVVSQHYTQFPMSVPFRPTDLPNYKTKIRRVIYNIVIEMQHGNTFPIKGPFNNTANSTKRTLHDSFKKEVVQK